MTFPGQQQRISKHCGSLGTYNQPLNTGVLWKLVESFKLDAMLLVHKGTDKVKAFQVELVFRHRMSFLELDDVSAVLDSRVLDEISLVSGQIFHTEWQDVQVGTSHDAGPDEGACSPVHSRNNEESWAQGSNSPFSWLDVDLLNCFKFGLMKFLP